MIPTPEDNTTLEDERAMQALRRLGTPDSGVEDEGGSGSGLLGVG